MQAARSGLKIALNVMAKVNILSVSKVQPVTMPEGISL
jgi:hypothetical protein